MNFLAVPLGWILWFIYNFVKNYFAAIFIFTVVTRLLTFYFSVKSQKAQGNRARLQPKIDRLQKIYKKDPKKLQEMQMKLYEKEGISQTEGCANSIVPMILLFGIIAVIYSPLTYIMRIPKEVVDVSITAVTISDDFTAEQNEYKFKEKDMKAYKELNILRALDEHKENEKDVLAAITTLDEGVLKGKTAEVYLEDMHQVLKDFTFFGESLLVRPEITKFNLLLIIPLISLLTAVISGFISKKYMLSNQQQGQGCSDFMMVGLMPIFSLVMTFTVPAAVGVYWISSNIVAIIQTVALNKIYNLKDIKQEAEEEFEEERLQRKEDRKRLAESRRREQKQLALARQGSKKGKGKGSNKNLHEDENSEENVDLDEENDEQDEPEE